MESTISMSIIQQIEFMIEENKSSISINDVLTNLFNKYNITHDIIKTFINHDKCDECDYFLEYNSKVFLKCTSCNNINNCNTCITTINSNNHHRRNSINKTIECNNCSEKMNVDTCNNCHNIRCVCNIPFGC